MPGHASSEPLISRFDSTADTAALLNNLPDLVPSPFATPPHPLAAEACRLLQQRLISMLDPAAMRSGKMFGILVVRDESGQIGFLSAFSGMLNKQWQLPGFVPPLFIQADQDRFLLAGRATLADLTGQIERLEHLIDESTLHEQLSELCKQRDRALATLKLRHQAAKKERRQQRQTFSALSDHQRQHHMADLALASQHDKREATNAGLTWQQQIAPLQQQLDALHQQRLELTNRRAETSRQLHRQVFATYQLSNRLAETSPLDRFYRDQMPPAGSGDCAGPKLLHYAHHHRLTPIAMAEFWWGPSPSTGIRHHGHYYPACRGKCHPILPFMLRGIAVEAEPDYRQQVDADEPKTVYEDDAILLVNKPAGLLSAPGKTVHDSALSRLIERHPDIPELTLMHRLDMATSGLLLLAKNKKAIRFLHKQFLQHKIEKRYEALLENHPATERAEGLIDLPLRVDLDDRPRQMVCHQSGKQARTRWRIIGREGDFTRVHFEPLTGRTHQLRVHASHRDGLNAAIVGDALYGSPAERLMLHAGYLAFSHPVSRERMEFTAPTPF